MYWACYSFRFCHHWPGTLKSQSNPWWCSSEDKSLATTSIQDPGPDGISELEQIFKNFGKRVSAGAYRNDPLPEEARVLVLVRPLGPLPVPTVARLWAHILRGNHLLLAVDPIGQSTYRGEGAVKSNPDRANAGLPTLLWLAYGIGLQDTLVACSSGLALHLLPKSDILLDSQY